jgi:hypothetical protein
MVQVKVVVETDAAKILNLTLPVQGGSPPAELVVTIALPAAAQPNATATQVVRTVNIDPVALEALFTNANVNFTTAVNAKWR